MLDFYHDEGDYNDQESDKINTDTVDEIEDNKNEPHHQLSNYSIEYMQQVVDYADEKNSSGKHRRFQTLPDQSYINRFRNYLKQHGTKQQKT
jgi:hypothetical protein